MPLTFTDSTGLLARPDALRARAGKDGCLFFAGRLPAEPLLSLRAEILGIVRRHGLLEPGVGERADVEKLRGLPLVGGCTDDIYRDVQRLESFHTLAHHPGLLEIYETLFTGPVLPHPRNIARVLLPAPDAAATPPHQDFIHVQGSAQTWTAWFPLGACPRELGGLSVPGRLSKRPGVARRERRLAASTSIGGPQPPCFSLLASHRPRCRFGLGRFQTRPRAESPQGRARRG